jgi:hypothetical protein
MIGMITKMAGANSSDKDDMSGNRNIDGVFGSLNCYGRTLARGAFTVNVQLLL